MNTVNKELFKTFFYLGATTIGGGYAMIGFIEKIVVDDKKWLSHEELLDILAVSQATPGAIAINAATYVGKKASGKAGAILASLGVILPSILIISLLYPLLIVSFEHEKLNSLFKGIQLAVVALIINSVISIFSKGIKGVFPKLIFVFSLLCLFFTNINPIYLIILGGISNLIYTIIKGWK